MPARRKIPEDHPAFAGLPARMITLGDGRERAAVHVCGDFRDGRWPVICLAGYLRNMSDFADFTARFGRGWPIVLIDLQGRGRATDRVDKSAYGSPRDARDVSRIATSLGIARAIFIGQGYGGQVVMTLGAERPGLVGGAVLIDAGPVTDSRGIVRLRHNMSHIEGLRGAGQALAGYRRMLAGEHPGASEALLDRLAQRCHYFDRRGRARPLYDPYLLEALKSFGVDDVFSAQWPLFDALAEVPLLLMRTQLTDQLRRETFEEMVRRRPDAGALNIIGQGSPALFDHAEEVEAVERFVRETVGAKAAAR